jgi:molybdate transport system permease protein
MSELEGIAQPIVLTLSLAVIVTAILVVVATPIAWWLARSKHSWREGIGAVVALPLVLPPTVLGFYLLIAMGPNGPGGAIASLWGARTIAFSFEGLIIGSVIYSLPFIVQPLRNAFEAIGDDTLEAARTLGSGRWETFLRVELPLARPGYLTGAVLAFAHTVGEFGVVLMIGGNRPGETNVLSVTIFNFVERGLYQEAHILSLGMVIFALAAISATMIIDRRLSRIT